MSVMVESCEKTKSGKAWRVKLSGSYYNAFLDSGIETQIGKLIEAEIQTSEKFGPSLRAWKAVNSVNAAPQVSSPPSPAAPAAPVAAAPYTREPTYAEPAKPGTVAPFWSPMASNVVAHGIQAGVIKEPNEVHAWVRAVKMAMENDSDGDIPF